MCSFPCCQGRYSSGETSHSAVAYVRRQQKGSYVARWWSKKNQRVEVATGLYEFEAATRKANQLEAESRFWEEHEEGIWDAYANLGFSPKYCHDSFTHAKHLRFDVFKGLLKEAGVTFQAPNKWRDRRTRKAGGKRYKFRGKMQTLAEIIDRTGATIKASALRWRLDQGWSLEDAVATPVMSRSEAGSLGADATNNKQRRGQRA